MIIKRGGTVLNSIDRLKKKGLNPTVVYDNGQHQVMDRGKLKTVPYKKRGK